MGVWLQSSASGSYEPDPSKYILMLDRPVVSGPASAIGSKFDETKSVGVTFSFNKLNAGFVNSKLVSVNISTLNITPPNASWRRQEVIISVHPVLSQEIVIKLSSPYASAISYMCSLKSPSPAKIWV